MDGSAYISGPLQAAQDLAAARDFYLELAQVAEDAGWEPYVPHLHTDPELHPDVSGLDVFMRDVQALTKAGLLIADLRAPSLGVGAELGMAYNQQIPIVGLSGPDGIPSRFAIGLLERYRDGHLFEIDGKDLNGLRELLEALRHSSAPKLAQAG